MCAERGTAELEKGAVDAKLAYGAVDTNVEPGWNISGAAGAVDQLIYNPAVQTGTGTGFRVWTGKAKSLEVQPSIQVITETITAATDPYRQGATESKTTLRRRLQRLRLSEDIDQLEGAKFSREVAESAQKATWLAEREVVATPLLEDCVVNVVFVALE
jgi:hypothetical protein